MPVWGEERTARRLEQLPGWMLKANTITKEYKLGSFPAALEFVRQVAALAQAEQHHPDIVIRNDTVTLRLSTLSEGRVMEKDLALAAKIETLRRE